MDTVESLSARVGKLENQGPFRFFIQYLLSPILIAVIGTVINWRIETNKAESQKIELAQKMLPMLFAGKPDQAFATERLLAKVIAPDDAKEVKDIVSHYYALQISSDLRAGNLESAAKTLDAAKAVGGSAAQQVINTVKENPVQAQAIEHFNSGHLAAAAKEREGFENLLNGKFDAALDAFEQAEKAQPGYHMAYEITRLLRSKESTWDNPQVRQDTLQTILSQYSWGAPADLLSQLKSRAVH